MSNLNGDALEIEYAKRHGITVQVQRKMGIGPVKCHCGCDGYFMAQEVTERSPGIVVYFPVPLSDSHDGIPYVSRDRPYRFLIKRDRAIT